jgi:diguanylate cyclase (GGDEF)-like protein
MIFDVDDFKAVNDTYGHLAGDEVLREIAQRTEHSVRKSDICARYGGEEFVVIMPQTGSEGGLVQAERIREIVASGAFHCLPLGASVTVSVGVGVLDPDRMLMPEDLLRAADQALYSAKRSGKNRVMESK